jgi:hypothetical protein
MCFTRCPPGPRRLDRHRRLRRAIHVWVTQATACNDRHCQTGTCPQQHQGHVLCDSQADLAGVDEDAGPGLAFVPGAMRKPG